MGKIALEILGISSCQPFLIKCLYSLFCFLTFVHDFKVSLNFYNKFFSSAEDFDDNIFCFSFVDNLILITSHKVILEESFDSI